jgi:type IV pilus assembly protein PilQ
MDSRVSAGLLGRSSLLGVAALLLGACASDVAEVRPAPAAPPVVAAVPAPPVVPEPPRPVPAQAPAVITPAAPTPAPTEAAPSPAPVPAPALSPIVAAVPVAPAVPEPARSTPVLAPPAATPPPAPTERGPIEVTGVNVQETGPGGLAVTVTADRSIATYESFTLPDPPRLIVDIPNATQAIPQPISVRSPLITAIRSSQYREHPVKIVRVVMDLRSALPYQVVAADNQLRVQLGAGAGTAPTTPSAATATAAPVGKVTRVDFQRVRGRQRIVIATSGRVSYNVTDASDPPRILVDITGAQIDPANARTLDLRQVTSPVSRLQASQYQTAPEPVVRVVADLRSPTGYDVQQTPTAIVIELAPPSRAAKQAPPPRGAQTAQAAPPAVSAPPPAAPAATPPAPPPPAPLAPGPGRLSMDFRDADINNLLRIIAEVSGMNVVAGSDVSGKVTVRLVNVDWQQALDVILKINNLGYELDGNVIRVAPLAKLDAERKAREDARVAAARARETEQRAQIQLEPLVNRVIAVNYTKADDVSKQLDRLRTPGRPDASITYDLRTNTLIINDTAAAVARMETLLKRLDIPTPQVLIEARIVEATRTFSQSLGIEWGFTFNSLNASGAAGNMLTPVSVFTSPTGSPTMNVPTSSANMPLSISFPASGANVSSVGVLAGNLINNALLGVRFSAAENEGKARVLSAPKVATMDNQEAEIRQGTQVPYTTVDSSGRTVVAFQDAFIRLKVTPHITNDRRISMKVEAEKTQPGPRIDFVGGFAFPLDQRKATTNILVSNGATIVIGGLMQASDNVTESGLPWLKNIPVLGWAFKSTSIGPNDKTELLIFLTPTILEEPRLS